MGNLEGTRGDEMRSGYDWLNRANAYSGPKLEERPRKMDE